MCSNLPYMRACIHLVLSCLYCVSVFDTCQMIVYLKVCLCYCHSNGEGATLVSRESEVIVCVGVCYDSGGRLWLSVLCWLALRHRLMNKGLLPACFLLPSASCHLGPAFVSCLAIDCPSHCAGNDLPGGSFNKTKTKKLGNL